MLELLDRLKGQALNMGILYIYIYRRFGPEEGQQRHLADSRQTG